MKWKSWFSLLLLLSLPTLFIHLTVYGKEPDPDPCDVTRLPAKIQETLKKNFSAWRMITLKDLSKDDQGFWTRSEKRNDCPGMAFGHYETKSAFSYVLSLVPRTGNLMGYRLIIFSPEEKGRYQEEVLEKYDGPANPLVVYTVPPGRYWNDENTRSVQLSMEGFQSEEKEKGAFLYYWEKGTFHQWTISE